jgi:putative endopeptidase
MAEIRTAYRAYLGQLLQLAGCPIRKPAPTASLPSNRRCGGPGRHHRQPGCAQGRQSLDPRRLRHRAPGLDWAAFWTAAGVPASQRDFIAWQPGAITKLSALVASEPLQSWRDWLAFHMINQVTGSLPKAIDDASFGFYGRTLTGTPAQQPREKRGIAAVNGALGEAVGKIYARRYFPASSKVEIQHMVTNIVAAFDRRIAALDWMAPATKAEARPSWRCSRSVSAIPTIGGTTRPSRCVPTIQSAMRSRRGCRSIAITSPSSASPSIAANGG